MGTGGFGAYQASGHGAQFHTQRLKDRFKMLDANGDGTLTFQEMAGLLRRGNPDFTDGEIKVLFDAVDMDGSGRVEFNEFCDFIHSQENSHEGVVRMGSPLGRHAHPDKQDRVRMECPTCGYKCYPSWMNDEAHCLKCDTVLRRRPGCHG